MFKYFTRTFFYLIYYRNIAIYKYDVKWELQNLNHLQTNKTKSLTC